VQTACLTGRVLRQSTRETRRNERMSDIRSPLQGATEANSCLHGTIESAMIAESGAQWLKYPWTLATYILQIGGLGMVAIGAVYWLLPGDKLETESVDYTALWLCIVGLIATFLTSYVGYFVANAIWPSFFYKPITQEMHAWIMSQVVSVALYLFGVVLAFFSICHVTDTRIPHG